MGFAFELLFMLWKGERGAWTRARHVGASTLGRGPVQGPGWTTAWAMLRGTHGGHRKCVGKCRNMWGVTPAWTTAAFNGRRARARRSRDTGLRGRLLNTGWDAKGRGTAHGRDTWRGAGRVQKGRLAAGMRGGSTHAGSWNPAILPQERSGMAIRRGPWNLPVGQTRSWGRRGM